MLALRCRGCGQQIGVTREDRFWGSYCNIVCASIPAPSQQEDRDCIVDLLERLGTPQVEIAEELNLSRQRVYQIITRRRAA